MQRFISFLLLITLFIPSLSSFHTPAAALPNAPLDYDCAGLNYSLLLPAACQVLVDLYHSTNGPYWNNQGGWMVTLPCYWDGVYCEHDPVTGRETVTGLSLSSNGLSGSLPAFLTNLPALRAIDFSDNQLLGSIPAQYSTLTELETLSLSSNKLSSSIPPELGNLDNLESLELGGNLLSGTIPVELANLTQLRNLHLTNNRLFGAIPPELGNLTHLGDLGLGNNQLTGTIPLELGSLINLGDLDLGSNQLTGTIPPELGNLTQLTSLILDNNRLSGSIPPVLGSLVDLYNLHLDNNQLSGPIPSELGSLTSLFSLDLSNNHLTGAVPEQLVNLTSLFNPGTGGWLGGIGLCLDYNRLDVPSPYPATPPTALQAFLEQKNPDWHLTQSISAAIPAQGAVFASRDGHFSADIPPDALTETTVLEFLPQKFPDQPAGALRPGQLSFQLNAADQSGAPLDPFAFSKPITVTLSYTDAEIGGIAENRLALYYWDKTALQWKDARTTCSPNSTYLRDAANHRLSVEICHLSEFGLFGPAQINVYIPGVRR